MAVEEITRTPRPKCLLIRYRNQLYFPAELVGHRGKIVIGEDRSRRADFHVAHAAAENLAAVAHATPRLMRPAGGTLHRENVDMPVKHERFARSREPASRNNVWHLRYAGDFDTLMTVACKEIRNVPCRLSSIAGRIWRFASHKILNETQDFLSISIDPLPKILLHSNAPCLQLNEYSYEVHHPPFASTVAPVI